MLFCSVLSCVVVVVVVAVVVVVVVVCALSGVGRWCRALGARRGARGAGSVSRRGEPESQVLTGGLTLEEGSSPVRRKYVSRSRVGERCRGTFRAGANSSAFKTTEAPGINYQG